MQSPINLKPLYLREQENIAVIFPYHRSIDVAVRKINGIKWAQTHRCWYLPLSKENFALIDDRLKEFGPVNFDELKNYLEKETRLFP